MSGVRGGEVSKWCEGGERALTGNQQYCRIIVDLFNFGCVHYLVKNGCKPLFKTQIGLRLVNKFEHMFLLFLVKSVKVNFKSNRYE